MCLQQPFCQWISLVINTTFITCCEKVAETLLNPFGEDDDDFDINGLIDSNLQVKFAIFAFLYQWLQSIVTMLSFNIIRYKNLFVSWLYTLWCTDWNLDAVRMLAKLSFFAVNIVILSPVDLCRSFVHFWNWDDWVTGWHLVLLLFCQIRVHI